MSRYKIYLRDWYYNAGIIGFLTILSKGEINIENIKDNFGDKVEIGENFIDFDSEILSGFYENYKRMAFNLFFDIEGYKLRIEKFERKVNQLIHNNSKITKQTLTETGLSGKVINNFIKEIYDSDFNEILNDKNISQKVVDIKNILEKFVSNFDIYEELKNNNSGFIKYFLDQEIAKRICNYENIENYITKLSQTLVNPKNNDQKCFICMELKKEYEFNNAITQILGFNKDNSNWIWGYKTTKTEICPLCALIYSCAVHGMIFLNKKIDNKYKTFFYALNRNTDLTNLYGAFWIFKENIEKKKIRINLFTR